MLFPPYRPGLNEDTGMEQPGIKTIKLVLETRVCQSKVVLPPPEGKGSSGGGGGGTGSAGAPPRGWGRNVLTPGSLCVQKTLHN